MKKLKVSIGIPAYNEEGNIGVLLQSILRQKEQGFSLLEIIVATDGSNDNTADKVEEIKDHRIKLVIGKNRKGKPYRLNQILRLAKGEIIVLFDADVTIGSDKTIFELIKPFTKDKKIGLVGGNALPLTANTFIEASINTSFHAYQKLQRKLKNGHNVYGCNGPILALSKNLAKNLTIPSNFVADDIFFYFYCLKKGFKFKHAASAKVYFRSPQTINDQLSQNKRFITARMQLKQTFGKIVDQEYYVPKFTMYKILFQEFLKSPILGLSIFFINLYCRFLSRKENNKKGHLWNRVTSTKRKIIAKHF